MVRNAESHQCEIGVSSINHRRVSGQADWRVLKTVTWNGMHRHQFAKFEVAALQGESFRYLIRAQSKRKRETDGILLSLKTCGMEKRHSLRSARGQLDPSIAGYNVMISDPN